MRGSQPYHRIRMAPGMRMGIGRPSGTDRSAPAVTQGQAPGSTEGGTPAPAWLVTGSLRSRGAGTATPHRGQS